jgi:predicted small secreted protein
MARRGVHATASRCNRERTQAAMTSKATAMICAALLALAGCNTAEGIGEDLESAGEAIDQEAEEHD